MFNQPFYQGAYGIIANDFLIFIGEETIGKRLTYYKKGKVTYWTRENVQKYKSDTA